MKSTLLTLTILLLITNFTYSQESEKADDKGKPVPITQLDPKRSERTPFKITSGIFDQRRIVVKDRKDWEDVWKQIYVSYHPAPPLPEIDFSREMLIVASSGSKSTGGYSIVIEGAYEKDDRLEVHVLSVAPGPNCMLTQALTAPVDVVRLAKTKRSVVFKERRTQVNCGLD